MRRATGTARCSIAFYLRWQREHHRVVIVDGDAEPNSTTLPDASYKNLAALAATAELDPAPFATANDFARIALDLLGGQRRFADAVDHGHRQQSGGRHERACEPCSS